MIVKIPNLFPHLANGNYMYIYRDETSHFLHTSLFFDNITKGKWCLTYFYGSVAIHEKYFLRSNVFPIVIDPYISSRMILKSNNYFYSILNVFANSNMIVDENYFRVPQISGYPIFKAESIRKCDTFEGAYRDIDFPNDFYHNVSFSGFTESTGDEFGKYGSYYYGYAKYKVSGGLNRNMIECVNKKFKNENIRGFYNPYTFIFRYSGNNDFPPNSPKARKFLFRFFRSEEDDLYLYKNYAFYYILGNGFVISFEEPTDDYDYLYKKGFWFYPTSDSFNYPYTDSYLNAPVGTYVRYYGGEEPDPYPFNLTVTYDGMHYQDITLGMMIDCNKWVSEYA